MSAMRIWNDIMIFRGLGLEHIFIGGKERMYTTMITQHKGMFLSMEPYGDMGDMIQRLRVRVSHKPFYLQGSAGGLRDSKVQKYYLYWRCISEYVPVGGAEETCIECW
jgi:hypothetical protein